MTRVLRYGEGEALHIDPPPEARLTDLTAPPGKPLADPAAAVQSALADPLDFPPITRATVRGDRVVLAVDSGVPQLPAVVAGAVRALLAGDVFTEDITIVLAPANSKRVEEKPTSLLPPGIAAEVKIAEHDPGDHESLSYLAASKENRPIYVNRLLFDADVVLPIGCLRPDTALGYLGVCGGVFPAFSDEETRQRFRSTNWAESEVHRRRYQQESDEASWLLGVQLILQVVPGLGDTILHVLAGQGASVAERGRRLCEDAWTHQIPERAGLVVASIEGSREEQTWDNFARALFTALLAVSDDGAIVLCTDLRCEPGPALQRLAVPDDDEAILRDIRRDRSRDAVSASLVVEARNRAKVYLMSGLDEATVEDLGVGFVTREEEINRLARQFDSCILLANAHRAMLRAADDG
jgi:nickel-dependent lactate racemase